VVESGGRGWQRAWLQHWRNWVLGAARYRRNLKVGFRRLVRGLGVAFVEVEALSWAWRASNSLSRASCSKGRLAWA
jgi:hypothetical protein